MSISTAIIARSSRPAALIRGARPNPIIPVVSFFLSSDPLTSIKALQPGARPRRDPGQAVPHHHPILVRERHHVGDRRQRDQSQGTDQEFAEVGRGPLAVAKALADLPGQLERDRRAAQIGAGLMAAGQAWVDDRVGLRQRPADRVVVGDDQLDAQLARQLGLAHRRDAAIDRDDQLGLVLGRQLAQGLGIDPVAFLDAMGDVVLDVGGPGQPQARPQDAGAAHAVDVVVAVNDDLAIIPDRPDDPLGGLDRAGQQLGVVQASQPGLEKRPRSGRVVDAAIEQKLRDQRRDPAPRLRLWMRAGSWGLIRQRAFIDGDVLGLAETARAEPSKPFLSTRVNPDKTR